MVYNAFTAVSQNVVIEKLMQFRVSPVGGNRRWKTLIDCQGNTNMQIQLPVICCLLSYERKQNTCLSWLWNSLQRSFTYQISKCSNSDAGALPSSYFFHKTIIDSVMKSNYQQTPAKNLFWCLNSETSKAEKKRPSWTAIQVHFIYFCIL